MSTLRPLANRLVIKKIEALRTTTSGLLIIDALASRPNTGEVIAVGPDVKGVVPGDQVLFCSGTGIEFKVNDVAQFMMRDDDLFGVIK